LGLVIVLVAKTDKEKKITEKPHKPTPQKPKRAVSSQHSINKYIIF
jgi:hypothetical protein